MAAPQDRLGQQMGEYRLLHMLGQGAFGAVYLAEHVHDGSQAAVKLLQVRLTHIEDFKAFLNEARTIRLRHPHIVPLLDFGLNGENQPFLVMEYAAGGTLRDRHAKGSRLPLPTIVSYAQQVASALQYAHERRVIHRDVKPENMLVRADGTLLLSDFGIATVAHSSHSVNLQQGIGGTLPYMAPEQIQGKPRPSSDQYTLAIVVYEWIAGQRPFQGTAVEIAMQHAMTVPPPLLELVPTLPKNVEQVVLKALAKDPKERFGSIKQFAQALQAAIQPPSDPAPQDVSATPASPSVTLMPSTPIPVSQSSTALPTLAGIPVETVSTSEQSQRRSRISDTPLPQSDIAQPASTSAQADLAETLMASDTPTRSPLTSPTTSSTRAALTPRPPYASPAQPEAASGSALAPGTRRRRTILMGMLAALVLLLNGTGLWTVGAQLQVQHNQQATATAHAASFATATAAANAYRNAIESSGIQFGFDAQQTRNNPYERTISPANASRLHLLWSYQTGNTIDSSPVVANGVVYFGSDDHWLYALDATSGKKLWSYQTGNNIWMSSPAVANGVVYFGSTDDWLYALDATSGKKLWSYQTGGKIWSSPAVANGVVYFGSADDSLYALDATSGKKLWSYQTGLPIEFSPAVANGVVYVGSWDNSLYALDATSGKKLWSYQTRYYVNSPAVANGVVYASSADNSLYALDAPSGKKLWSYQTGGNIESSLGIANGVVYVSSADNSLYALDATSGKKLWSYQTGNNIWGSSPAVANGVVYFGSTDDSLYALDATSGKKLWSYQTGDKIWSSPAVANGVVYVGSDDHKLYAFGVQGGA